jgi:hypothetical protein
VCFGNLAREKESDTEASRVRGPGKSIRHYARLLHLAGSTSEREVETALTSNALTYAGGSSWHMQVAQAGICSGARADRARPDACSTGTSLPSGEPWRYRAETRRLPGLLRHIAWTRHSSAAGGRRPLSGAA